MNYSIAKTKVALQTKQAFDSGYRVIAHQGGTRSGKTYGIIDLLNAIALTTNYSISIASLSFPHLKRGAMRDWQELMDKKGVYQSTSHNRTDHIYDYPLGGYIEFFSLDQPEKFRGPSRDILFINEANLIPYETWKQLLYRTKKLVIIDYNPSDEFHWIYDEVLTRPDCQYIQSTYKDNPFLNPSQRQEIERDKDGDEDHWKVYGLGERGKSGGLIYTHWKSYETLDYPDDIYYGLDFGFNNPSALIRESVKDNSRYWEEIFYESRLDTSQLIDRIKPVVGSAPVYCDSDEGILISSLQQAGINAFAADKSVKMGIDEVKCKPLFIHKYSANLLKEIKSYRWTQPIEGKELRDDLKDKPIKRNDHLMDAGRYAAYTHDKMLTAPVISFHR